MIIDEERKNPAGDGMEGDLKKRERVFSLFDCRHLFGVYLFCIYLHPAQRYHQGAAEKQLCVDDAVYGKGDPFTDPDPLSGLCQQFPGKKAAEGIRSVPHSGTGKEAYRHHAVLRDDPALCGSGGRRRALWDGTFQAAVSDAAADVQPVGGGELCLLPGGVSGDDRLFSVGVWRELCGGAFAGRQSPSHRADERQ